MVRGAASPTFAKSMEQPQSKKKPLESETWCKKIICFVIVLGFSDNSIDLRMQRNIRYER